MGLAKSTFQYFEWVNMWKPKEEQWTFTHGRN